MEPTDDNALLRQYVESQSDDAFAALVTRHLNLVYSVALRAAGDPHLAEEIAQNVFITLARKGRDVRHGTALSSWLFQTTRLTAKNLVRSESRRHRRDLEAHMQSVVNDLEGDLWPRIAPLLDDAVAELNEPERQAIMLRFFEGRNLRDVGLALGASQDAAEKRVHRAVEKLRRFLALRGVSLGTSGLTMVLAANAVQAAPVGLAATISASAVTATAAAGAFTATQAIAMTTLQKTLFGAALATVTSVAVFQTHQASTLRGQIVAGEEQQAPQAAKIQQLIQERDDAVRQLTEERATFARPAPQAPADREELLRLRGEVGRLRQELAALPGRAAPAAGPPGASEPAAAQQDDLRQLALAASQGEAAALQRLDELSQLAYKSRNETNVDAHRDLRAAFKIIGEEAGKGSETAFQALWQATRMQYLNGMAVQALGEAAAMGNEKALEPLLDPKRYLLNNASATGALVPVAKNGNIRAIESLAAIAIDPKRQAEWGLVINGLKQPAATGNAAAIDALTNIGRSSANENLRKTALLALETAAFNNQAKATEALRSLGYQ